MHALRDVQTQQKSAVPLVPAPLRLEELTFLESSVMLVLFLPPALFGGCGGRGLPLTPESVGVSVLEGGVGGGLVLVGGGGASPRVGSEGGASVRAGGGGGPGRLLPPAAGAGGRGRLEIEDLVGGFPAGLHTHTHTHTNITTITNKDGVGDAL